MQCREFQEISESYLCDELLVETNHQVNHHLEHCSDCRKEFFARKRFREQVKSAVLQSADFQIRPVFSNRLIADLKQEALGSGRSAFSLFRPWIFLPAASILLVALFAGLMYLARSDKANFGPSPLIGTTLTQFAHFVANDHRDCALEKLGMWEQMSKKSESENEEFAKMVSDRLKNGYPLDLEVLAAHDCLFEGKELTHVILRSNGRVISVYFDKTIRPSSRSDQNQVEITTSRDRDLQIATFIKNSKAVSVVSNLSEQENRLIADRLAEWVG